VVAVLSPTPGDKKSGKVNLSSPCRICFKFGYITASLQDFAVKPVFFSPNLGHQLRNVRFGHQFGHIAGVHANQINLAVLALKDRDATG
jgi:hypothetical protein